MFQEKRLSAGCLVLMMAMFSALPGCSALKNNVTLEAPSEGPTANVRVIIPPVSNTYRGVRAYPNSACSSLKVPGNGMVISGQLIGFEKHLNGQSLGMPPTRLSKKDDNIQSEIRVAADRPITFSYTYPASSALLIGSTSTTNTYRVYNTGCSAVISFVPEEGGDYELTFGDKAAVVCPYSVTKLTPQPGEDGFASAAPVAAQVVKACRR